MLTLCTYLECLAFQYLKQVLKIDNEYSQCTTSGPANQSKRPHHTESSVCKQFVIFLKHGRSKKQTNKKTLMLYLVVFTLLPDIKE